MPSPAPSTGTPDAAVPPPRARPLRQRRWWPWTVRLVVAVLVCTVLAVLVVKARSVDWDEVRAALHAYSPGVLAAAAALAALSHLLYATFDLVGRRYTGHTLGTGTVMTITFIAYAFNLNMGMLVGTVGTRARLYARQGLDAPTIARIVGSSVVTNWLGYAFLAGVLFIAWPLALPPDWRLSDAALRHVGVAMVATAALYLLACAFSPRREWTLFGHEIALPSLRVALVQLALSCANWAVMGATIHTLLPGGVVAYPTALAVLLVGAVAGILSRVPAGLGVLEAVFVALLAPPLAPAGAIAAVLCYRALYYWAPLVVAAVAYVVMELRTRLRNRRR